MNLQDLRKKIDEIDDGLVGLFQKRMDVSAEIARFKRENDKPVYDPERERQVLYDLSGKATGREKYITALYSLLFGLSRSEQARILNPESELATRIENAVRTTDWAFPERTVVACQGVEGAYSQIAAQRLFAIPAISYFNTFENVFAAIESDMCAYGVVPLENSTAGSVNRVYDLLEKYPFHIVRSVNLKVDHCLLAKDGVALSDIKEIYSHEQAIAQCAEYLKTLNCEVIPCENTAVAAQMVANSERTDIAALSSRRCAEIYGLNRLATSIQDRGNNQTRFICVSKSLEIYPGANKTSIMFSVKHEVGSLYRVLAGFYANGVNLVKLESRPIPERDFDFMFYLDLEAPVQSPALAHVLDEVRDACEDFYYLGSYSEVM